METVKANIKGENEEVKTELQLSNLAMAKKIDEELKSLQGMLYQKVNAIQYPLGGALYTG